MSKLGAGNVKDWLDIQVLQVGKNTDEKQIQEAENAGQQLVLHNDVEDDISNVGASLADRIRKIYHGDTEFAITR